MESAAEPASSTLRRSVLVIGQIRSPRVRHKRWNQPSAEEYGGMKRNETMSHERLRTYEISHKKQQINSIATLIQIA
jgi:hypothetical protein